MAQAATAGLLAGVIGLAAPAVAGALSTLEPVADRCFEAPGVGTCGSFFALSHRLREQADHNGQLRCYTSLLSLEAVASKALRGIQDPAHRAKALQDAANDCP